VIASGPSHYELHGSESTAGQVGWTRHGPPQRRAVWRASDDEAATLVRRCSAIETLRVQSDRFYGTTEVVVTRHAPLTLAVQRVATHG
jgi:hypothetical protein